MTARLRHPVETAEERRARHCDALHEMTDLAMEVARDSAAKTIAGNPSAGAPDPSRTFARATHAARQAIALETRVASGDSFVRASAGRVLPRPPAPFDRRRAPLRQALHQAAAAEPDRAARTALCRHIDERIDLELYADPAAIIPTPEILGTICDTIGLVLDPKHLSDEMLGLTRQPIPPDSPGSGPAIADRQASAVPRTAFSPLAPAGPHLSDPADPDSRPDRYPRRE